MRDACTKLLPTESEGENYIHRAYQRGVPYPTIKSGDFIFDG